VRYDLRGKVAKLAAPFADPADAKGATARKMVPPNEGAFYPVTEFFDVRLDSASYSTEPNMGHKVGAGKRFVNTVFTIRNKGRAPLATPLPISAPT
jgi:hypothetical protein